MLQVNSTDSNSGILVLDVLCLKHLDLQEVDLYNPNCSEFEEYDSRPKVLPLDITYRDVEITVRKMGGSGGPSGTNSIMLKDGCTKFGAESETFREELARWTRWISNGSTSWAAYRDLVAGRLVALEKIPGVLTVGIG